MPTSDDDRLVSELGFRRVDAADSELRHDVESLFTHYGGVQFRNVLLHEIGDIRYAVGEVEYRPTEDSMSRTRQTILLLTSPAMRLPQLTVMPKTMVNSILAGAMTFLGPRKVQVENSTEFNEHYVTATFQPKSAAELMDAEVVEACLIDPRWTIQMSDDSIVIFRADEVVSSQELMEFMAAAQPVLLAFRRSAERLAAAGSWNPEAEAKQFLADSNSLAGKLLSRQTVPAAAFEEFLAEPPPRRVPSEVRAHYLGFGSIFLGVWGAMFFLGGSGLFLGFLFTEDRPEWSLLFAALFPLIGGTVLAGVVWYRGRIKRLLRHGRCLTAKILEVKSTSTYINNERQYRIRFEIDADGRTRQVWRGQGARAVDKARALKKSGETTRVLVAPGNFDRLLWIDAVTTR